MPETDRGRRRGEASSSAPLRSREEEFAQKKVYEQGG